MNITHAELAFLAAWAREEAESACYHLPAHRLQLAHGVPAESMTVLIKAWALANLKKDREILLFPATADLRWPWSSNHELQERLSEARKQVLPRPVPAA